MHRTVSRSTENEPDGRPGGERAAGLEPAWRPWVRLLELVLEAGEDLGVEVAPLEGTRRSASVTRAGDVPLLDGAVIRVDARRIRPLVRRLVRSAVTSGDGGASLARLRSHRLDALALVGSAITHDVEAIEQMAGAVGADAEALGVVAQLTATPVLRACAAQLKARVPEDWLNGFCPICGAWPVIAELRGLERNRRLRCGRCASDWPLPILRCPFCSEVRHDQLGSLLLEGHEQTRRVDTCRSCGGYVKTFTILRAMTPRSIALEDLATVELDLAAEERGYKRPLRPGFQVHVTVRRKAPHLTTPLTAE